VERRPGLQETLGQLVDRHRWEELRSYAMLQFLDPPQTEETLATLTTPTLILVGEQEMPAFRECAATLERCLPNACRIDLPDTDHLCMLQSPHLCIPLIAAHLCTPLMGIGKI
jgi:pimeloyl-ACP methyl ester carboxylesterase